MLRTMEDVVRLSAPLVSPVWILVAGCGLLKAVDEEPIDSGTAPTSATATETGTAPTTPTPTPGGFEPSDIEIELWQQINAYRKANALPELGLSRSLSFVARVHAEDQVDHYASFDEACNLHSWSQMGPWTPCCYTADHAQAQCMWDKPDELTDYPGLGYEISSFGRTDAAGHLAGWQSSDGHNDVILNIDTWSTPWLAMGVGIAGTHANVWFGHEADPAGDLR